MNAAPALQRAPLALGLAVLAAAWLGPLPGWAPQWFWAHMTMHVAVVAVAAPLIALGLGGSRLDPARRWPGVFRPVPVSALELVVIWAWHAPALHHLSRHAAGAMALEQASFLAVGLGLWLSALGGDAAQRDARRTAGIFGLLMTSMHMTLLGVLLALAPRALYGHGHGEAGLSPLLDQQIGGVLMLAAGGTSYLVGGLVLLAGVLHPRAAVAASPFRSGDLR